MQKRKPYFSNFRKGLTISIGLVFVLFNFWLLTHIEDYFPGNFELMFKVVVSYLLIIVFLLAEPSIRERIMRIRFIDFIPRVVFFFAVSVFVFYWVLGKVDPLKYSLYEVTAAVPWWLVLMHGFTFALTESLFWQGYLDEKVGHPWSELIAGFFHFGVWSGGAVLVIVGAGLLFAFFSYCHWLLRRNKSDFAPVAGIHWGFNVAKLMARSLI